MKKGGYELLLLDTAGRLHVDETMMQELVQVEKIIKPKYKYMVLDAMTGQESLKVAQAFDKQIGFNYAVLSKMDSDAQGGAAFAFRYTLQKPILFVGTGEKLEDLEIFRPERVASRILGMGDLATLLENATEKIQQHEQKEMSHVLSSGKITLEDCAKQLNMMSKLGSLANVVRFLPGMPTANLSPDMLEKGDKELKRFKAIINSMTRKERLAPHILDGSRKMRVAKGSGVLVQDVNLLLERFEQSKRFVKLFKNTKF
jgi:signal recognition particle subunit SRP54